MYAAPITVTSVHARTSSSESETAAAINTATMSTTIAANSVVSGPHLVSSCTARLSATFSTRSATVTTLSFDSAGKHTLPRHAQTETRSEEPSVSTAGAEGCHP